MRKTTCGAWTRTVAAAMRAAVDRAREAGDTVGGAFEVIARGVPPGLGSYVQWDRKLDGRLGASADVHPGDQGRRHRPRLLTVAPSARVRKCTTRSCRPSPTPPGRSAGLARPTNNAGGLEGGVTNGEDVRVTARMKPISTLMKPLRSVDLATMKEAPAAIERSDVCAVPAAAVVGEAMVALVLASARSSRSSAPTRIAEIDAAWRRYAGDVTRRLSPGPGTGLMLRPIVRYPAPALAGAGRRRHDVRRGAQSPDRRHDRHDVRRAGHRPGRAAGRRAAARLRHRPERRPPRRRSCTCSSTRNSSPRDGMQLEEEGCLSVPGFNATVARPATATIRALDRHGVSREITGTGLLARAFQHEVDHLDGTLFLDRLRGIKRDLIARKIRKLQRAGKLVMPLRLLYFGTPAFAVPTLAALARSSHRVVGVVTQPDRPRGRGHKVVPEAVKLAAIDARTARLPADAAEGSRTPRRAALPRAGPRRRRRLRTDSARRVPLAAAARTHQRARVAAASLAWRRADPPRHPRGRRRRPA